MSRTHAIPRASWESFFNAMAKTERDRRVWLEVDTPEQGAQRVAEHLPFVGVSMERKGADDVDVMLEAGLSGDFVHRVASAEKVYALEGDDGRLECLDIEAGATHTLVHFD